MHKNPQKYADAATFRHAAHRGRVMKKKERMYTQTEREREREREKTLPS